MKTQYFLSLILSLILGIVIGYFLFKGVPLIPEPLNNYITDTVYITKYLKPKPLLDQVKPHIVKLYMSSEDSMKLVRLNDSLQIVLSTTKPDTVYISDGFLTQFPKSPKLLSLDLQMDSLGLTLLFRDASIKGFLYPLQLSHYRYRFDETGLTAEKIKPTPSLVRPTLVSELYGFGGYELLTGSPHIGLNYSLRRSRIIFQNETKLTIENKPRLESAFRIGYQIKQWPKR